MDSMLKDISAKGEKILKPFNWIIIATGCNIMERTKFQRPLKLFHLFLLMTAIMAVMAQLHYVWSHRDQSVDVYVDAIIAVLQSIESICKWALFRFSQNRLCDMIQSVQNSEVLKDLTIFDMNLVDQSKIVRDLRQILNESWLDIKKQLILFVASVFCICIWFYVHSLFMDVYHCSYLNQQEFEIQYPFPASFPMWQDKGMKFPYFFIQYMLIAMELYFAGLSAITFTGLFSVFSVHCLALLRILRKFISYSTSYHVVPEDRPKYLQACIKLHQRILEFSNELNSLYRMLVLPLFLVSCLIMCLLIFHATVNGLVSTNVNTVIQVMLYFSASCSEVTLFCINGQRITSESELLPLEIYECQWYNENDHFKYMAQIMILKSNQHISVDVGGFAKLSLVTLLAIYRSSASYCLFLLKCM